MRSTIRTATLGALLVGGAIALAACGSTPAAAPTAPVTPKTSTVAPATPVAARKYAAAWLQTQLTSTKNQDGTSTLTAACVDSTVKADGSGSYECFETYSDNTSGTNEIDVTSDGNWASKGATVPSSQPVLPSYASALVGNVASVNAYLMNPLNGAATSNLGDSVADAQCKDGPVDASGTEKFSCAVTWKTGISGTLVVAVTSAGAVSFPSS